MADPGFITLSTLGIAGPASVGTYTAIPYTTISIVPQTNPVTVDLYDATRQKSATVGGAYSVNVQITGLLNHEAGMQDLLEFAVGGSFSTGTLRPSDTNNKAAVTFDLQYKIDLASDDFVIVGNCIVQELALNFPLQGPATYSATILGESLTVNGTVTGTMGSLAGLGPFAAGLPSTGITYNAGALDGIESCSLTIRNAVSAKYEWGSQAADHITLGNMRVSGELTQYYRDDVLLAAVIANTIEDLVIVLKNGESSNNTLTITITKAKFLTGGIGTSDTTLTLDSIGFESVYDSTNKLITYVVS